MDKDYSEFGAKTGFILEEAARNEKGYNQYVLDEIRKNYKKQQQGDLKNATLVVDRSHMDKELIFYKKNGE